MSKTWIITGASAGGIGEGIARAVLSHGDNAVITARSLSKLESIAKDYPDTCLPVTLDMSDRAQMKEVVAKAVEKFGTVDVLINNAGISYVGLLTDMTPSDWKMVMDTNLSYVFYCCSKAIPMMLKKQSGRIINISSMWGTCGASCEVAYSASKGGMDAFTKALAKELAPSGITVNAIACGVIDTEMNHCFSEEELEALAVEIPIGRFGAPEEVADFALQIASGHAYLTGQIIHLDGGYL